MTSAPYLPSTFIYSHCKHTHTHSHYVLFIRSTSGARIAAPVRTEYSYIRINVPTCTQAHITVSFYYANHFPFDGLGMETTVVEGGCRVGVVPTTVRTSPDAFHSITFTAATATTTAAAAVVCSRSQNRQPGPRRQRTLQPPFTHSPPFAPQKRRPACISDRSDRLRRCRWHRILSKRSGYSN